MKWQGKILIESSISQVLHYKASNWMDLVNSPGGRFSFRLRGLEPCSVISDRSFKYSHGHPVAACKLQLCPISRMAQLMTRVPQKPLQAEAYLALSIPAMCLASAKTNQVFKEPPGAKMDQLVGWRRLYTRG